jgi:hypothetical protein
VGLGVAEAMGWLPTPKPARWGGLATPMAKDGWPTSKFLIFLKKHHFLIFLILF